MARKGHGRPCSRAQTFSGPTWGSKANRHGGKRSMKRGTLTSLTIVALALAGCTIGVGTPAHSMGVIKLGADLSLNGDDASDGMPARNAIDLAVKEAGRVCGPSRHPDACFDVDVPVYDDVNNRINDPAVGAQY